MKKRFLVLINLLVFGVFASGCNLNQSKLDLISMDSAKSIALEAADFSASEVTFTAAELSERNGQKYYAIDFNTENGEYNYDIDALTGAVINANTPDKTKATETAIELETTASSTETEKSSTETTSTSKELSKEKAKEIALGQIPGAKASHIVEFETDYDDGRLEYDGKIQYDGMEYEFEIDGYSGAIRSWDVEPIMD